MRPDPSRRRFLQQALSVGATAACAWTAPPALAVGGGRVLIGFQVPPSALAHLAALLKEIQPNYQPDLGVKPVVLPGASGALAIETVARSVPDGGTVLIAPSSLLTLLPVVQKMPVDPATILTPVAAIGGMPIGFMVGPAVPLHVRTMADYVEWVRTNPSRNTYGIPGLGLAPQFIGDGISRRADVSLRVVAYKGQVALADDLQSGALPAAITLMPSPGDLQSHPGIRVLGVSSSERIPGFPGIQTLEQSGLAEPTPIETLGFFVPTGTAQPKVAELAAAVRTAVQAPSVLDAMAVVAMLPAQASADTYAVTLLRERATWQKLVAQHGFTAQG